MARPVNSDDLVSLRARDDDDEFFVDRCLFGHNGPAAQQACEAAVAEEGDGRWDHARIANRIVELFGNYSYPADPGEHVREQLPAPGYVPDNLDLTTKKYSLYFDPHPINEDGGPLEGVDRAQYRLYEVGEIGEDGSVRYHDQEIDTEWTYTTREGSHNDAVSRELSEWASTLFGRPIHVGHDNGSGADLHLLDQAQYGLSADYDDEVATLRRSFEFELCEHCGGDLDAHTIGPDPLGHAHLFCNANQNDTDDDLSPDAARNPQPVTADQPDRPHRGGDEPPAGGGGLEGGIEGVTGKLGETTGQLEQFQVYLGRLGQQLEAGGWTGTPVDRLLAARTAVGVVIDHVRAAADSIRTGGFAVRDTYTAHHQVGEKDSVAS